MFQCCAWWTNAEVQGATIQFVRKYWCKAQPADFVPVSKALQVAAQQISGARHEEALKSAYEAWSRLAASELVPFLGIDGQKQADVARRCSRRDVKTRWVAPVASVNAPVCDVEVSKRAWCIARDRLTDLLCVVQKRVLPSYASQVGRALMRALRRWPDDFGVQWYAALKIWAGIARWAPEVLSGLQGHLAAAHYELATIALDLSLKAASARVRRWRKWAQSAVSDQKKPAFHWAKGRDLIPLPVPVMFDGKLMADTQVLVDDEFGKWQCNWRKDPMAEFCEVQLNELMPRPTLSEVRKAIRSFPMFTAVGHDEWEPWSWRHLSDGAIEALIDIGLAMENMMVHPRQCKVNILKLLPKPAGGYKTIGILPTLLRIWCRTRREFIRCWQLTNARSYFWGDAGRGFEKAVWWESLANESCVLKGRQAVTVLLDLFKCFERVLHVIAFKNALK